MIGFEQAVLFFWIGDNTTPQYATCESARKLACECPKSWQPDRHRRVSKGSEDSNRLEKLRRIQE